jgi:hypothetical protein
VLLISIGQSDEQHVQQESIHSEGTCCQTQSHQAQSPSLSAAPLAPLFYSTLLAARASVEESSNIRHAYPMELTSNVEANGQCNPERAFVLVEEEWGEHTSLCRC